MNWKNLIWLFIKINLLSFGGPNVAISIIENELVIKEKIYTQEQLNKLFITTNVVPGPVFIQLSVIIGYEFKKIWGAIICLFISMSIIPGISIYIFFYLQKFIAPEKFHQFIVLLTPVIIIILLEFIYNSFKNISYKLNKYILFTEVFISAILIYFKVSIFIILLIVIFIYLIIDWWLKKNAD